MRFIQEYHCELQPKREGVAHTYIYNMNYYCKLQQDINEPPSSMSNNISHIKASNSSLIIKYDYHFENIFQIH